MAPQQPETKREGTALPEPKRNDIEPGEPPEWTVLEPVKGKPGVFQVALDVDALLADDDE